MRFTPTRAVPERLRAVCKLVLFIIAVPHAHASDPLGGMRVTAPQFGRLTALIASVADECCAGRVVAVTEGGYDLKALAASLRTTIAALAGDTTLEELPAPAGPTPRGDACLAAVLPHLRNYWTI